MSGEKYLIVSADDFGQSPGINKGIIEAHEHGIVTSTSLMTRWLAAGEAAIYAREHPKLSVGLHLDLGEWVCRAGKWTQLYSVIPLDDKSAVEREVSQQFDVFQKLMGRPPLMPTLINTSICASRFALLLSRFVRVLEFR